MSTQATVTNIWGPSNEKKTKRNAVPGHPTRYNRKLPPTKSKAFNVVLYPEDYEMRDKYYVDADDEILNGFVELSTNFSEDTIRSALRDLFQSKYSLIHPLDLNL